MILRILIIISRDCRKTFGSSFVKRVKKASSDLINIVPSRVSN